jgi:hypothetical protein
MRPLTSRRVAPRRAAVIAAALAVTLAALPASAASLRDLAGWWIAIDDTFPKLWRREGVAAVEEMLLVNPDGRVENRTMNFWSGSAEVCEKTKVCGDLPLAATARIALKGDKLIVASRRAAGGRIDSAASDADIRRLSVTATAAWNATLKDRQLGLRGANATRTLARIEPDRLRRLRAGMRVSGQSADKHWRCFLANATARDSAFAPIRSAKSAPPGFLDSYLRAASYLATLNSMIRRPTPDDEQGRKLIGFDTEELLVEEFPDIRIPVSVADKRELQFKITYLERRVQGDNAVAATTAASEKVFALAGGPPAKVALSEAEIASLVRVMSGDAEAKKLFCR